MIDDTFNNLVKYCKQNKSVVKAQIKYLIESEVLKENIGNSILITLNKEFLVVNKNNLLIYKSFETKDMAIDYCLDKINTEGKQMSITSWEG